MKGIGYATAPVLGDAPEDYRCLVEAKSPPSTYAIAAWMDGEPKSGRRVLGLTLERAFFIGTGLAVAGLRGGQLVTSALAASSGVTGWIVADYALRGRGRTGLTPLSS